MKTGIMLVKATLIITVFAGLPHLVAQINGQDRVEPITYYDGEDQNWESYEQSGDATTIEDEESANAISAESATISQHPLIGYWYTAYEELEIGVTYQFRNENGEIKAYAIEIYDKEGNKASDNTLTMIVKSYDQNSGVADFFIEYEGEKYEVESKLKLVDNKLEVSYSYQGYDGKEIWERVTE